MHLSGNHCLWLTLDTITRPVPAARMLLAHLPLLSILLLLLSNDTWILLYLLPRQSIYVLGELRFTGLRRSPVYYHNQFCIPGGQ